MWFIKIDEELTLENVCDIIEMEPKALFNPLHNDVLNVILRDPNDTDKTGDFVYTNITMPFNTAYLEMKNGVPYGAIDKDISGINLYVDEAKGELADEILSIFDENDVIAMMTQI